MAAPSDMGGQTEFFGPLVREPDEPVSAVFDEPWQARVFGMLVSVLPLLGRNIHAFRFSMERLPRELYLSNYYRRWLGGLENMLVQTGYLGPDELDGHIANHPAAAGHRRPFRALVIANTRLLHAILRPVLPRWLAGRVLPRVLGNSRPALRRPRFAVGNRVRVRALRAPGHTRQPGYVTGKPGVVVAHLGSTLFPDAHAVGRRALPQHFYTVAFDGGDLWGEAAEPGTEVRVDLYESYLEALEAM